MEDLGIREIIKPELDENGVLTIHVIRYKAISAVTVNIVLINEDDYDNRI